MEVIVISDTIQEFMGERYYRCGKYFSRNMRGRKPKRLHRVVWEMHNGPIPAGFHIHHLDGNSAHNQNENLALRPQGEHLKGHTNTPDFKAAKRTHMEVNMRPKAIVWHKSAEGRAWHSQHARDRVRTKHEKMCVVCGTVFLTTEPKRAKYCSRLCKMRGFYIQRKQKESPLLA